MISQLSPSGQELKIQSFRISTIVTNCQILPLHLKIKTRSKYVDCIINHFSNSAGAITCFWHFNHGFIGPLQKGADYAWGLLKGLISKCWIGAVIFKTAPNVVELAVIPQGNYLSSSKVGCCYSWERHDRHRFTWCAVGR